MTTHNEFADATYWTAVALAALVVVASMSQPDSVRTSCQTTAASRPEPVIVYVPAQTDDDILKDMKLHD